MYIVHRDVLTLYAGKSVKHRLLHMESFTTSSLSVESLWLKELCHEIQPNQVIAKCPLN